MPIDMSALAQQRQGDPNAQIRVRKVWVAEVATMLDRMALFADRVYDTSALHTLASSHGGDKITVSRKWLSHIYDTLLDFQEQERASHARTVRKASQTRQATNIPVGVQDDFDLAFGKMDEGFSLMDRAFSKMRWR